MIVSLYREGEEKSPEVFMLGIKLNPRQFLDRVAQELDRIDAGEIKTLASPGDLLIAISGSGNSPNVLRAVEWANRNELKTFGCTGFSGGKLRALAQKGLHVPLDDMGIVESIHLTAFHWVVDDLYKRVSL